MDLAPDRSVAPSSTDSAWCVFWTDFGAVCFGVDEPCLASHGACRSPWRPSETCRTTPASLRTQTSRHGLRPRCHITDQHPHVSSPSHTPVRRLESILLHACARRCVLLALRQPTNQPNKQEKVPALESVGFCHVPAPTSVCIRLLCTALVSFRFGRTMGLASA
eukprot:3529671-Rhodomonas_salina.1